MPDASFRRLRNVTGKFIFGLSKCQKDVQAVHQCNIRIATRTSEAPAHARDIPLKEEGSIVLELRLRVVIKKQHVNRSK